MSSQFIEKNNEQRTINNELHTGDDGTRTHDFRLAKPALSQLSYVPETELVFSFEC